MSRCRRRRRLDCSRERGLRSRHLAARSLPFPTFPTFPTFRFPLSRFPTLSAALLSYFSSSLVLLFFCPSAPFSSSPLVLVHHSPPVLSHLIPSHLTPGKYTFIHPRPAPPPHITYSVQVSLHRLTCLTCLTSSLTLLFSSTPPCSVLRAPCVSQTVFAPSLHSTSLHLSYDLGFRFRTHVPA